MRRVCEQVGAKPFAAGQIARWLYGPARVCDIDAMTDLSKEVRRKLSETYTVGREAPLGVARSIDGTVKYIFRGTPGRNVESVYIPDRDRATLCVSSQAGCRMGCTFCMTGRGGLNGNLTAAQIINQVLSVENSSELTNIVFMGMGEPTDNIDAVLKVIEILTAPWGMAWSPKRITVSSIGRLPELERFLRDTRVHIAISVHSPFSVQRQHLMPAEKAWSLKWIFECLARYNWRGQRRLSVEYIMWKGVNDDIRHADALASMVIPVGARVNLIRFHDIGENLTVGDNKSITLRPSDTKTMERFRDRLNDLGVTATIRASRGEDIMAACGMLAGSSNEL